MATDLGTGLYAWVQTVSTLTAVLGTGDDCQFYPVAVLESKVPPLVVYEEDKDEEPATLTDAATVASSLVKFACIGSDTLEASNLAGLVHDALVNPKFSGFMGTVYVQGVLYKGSSPAYQWEEQQFAVDLTFKFWYRTS